MESLGISASVGGCHAGGGGGGVRAHPATLVQAIPSRSPSRFPVEVLMGWEDTIRQEADQMASRVFSRRIA
jgi:hypothetical protein